MGEAGQDQAGGAGSPALLDAGSDYFVLGAEAVGALEVCLLVEHAEEVVLVVVAPHARPHLVRTLLPRSLFLLPLPLPLPLQGLELLLERVLLAVLVVLRLLLALPVVLPLLTLLELKRSRRVARWLPHHLHRPRWNFLPLSDALVDRTEVSLASGSRHGPRGDTAVVFGLPVGGLAELCFCPHPGLPLDNDLIAFVVVEYFGESAGVGDGLLEGLLVQGLSDLLLHADGAVAARACAQFLFGIVGLHELHIDGDEGGSFLGREWDTMRSCSRPVMLNLLVLS